MDLGGWVGLGTNYLTKGLEEGSGWVGGLCVPGDLFFLGVIDDHHGSPGKARDTRGLGRGFIVVLRVGLGCSSWCVVYGYTLMFFFLGG